MGTSVSQSGDGELDLDAATDWFRTNGKALAIGLGGVVVVGAVAFFWRQSAQIRSDKAESALATAQSAYYSGNVPLAKTNLEKVVTAYSGTSGGAQAVLLLAQISYGDGKFDEGIKRLTDAKGSFPDDFAADAESMIADGYADSGKPADAADHYAKAADLSRFVGDKDTYHAAQARALTAAGKPDDARKIWVQLGTNVESPVYTEARVRLGELNTKPASK